MGYINLPSNFTPQKKLDKILILIYINFKIEKEVVWMVKKAFIYFLVISFLLAVNGFHRMVAEAKGKALPLGEMVSRGEVKFESRENIWKNVESSHFPIFQGVRVKIGKGMAHLSLTNGGVIEVKPNSLFSFTSEESLSLSQGGIEFRIPSGSELNFKIGKISISKDKPLQASRIPLSGKGSEEVIGSIQIHSNGALTLKTTQGKLMVLDEGHTVLAAVSPKEAITLPSSAIKIPPRTMVAQAGETAAAGTTGGGFLGLSTWTWVGIAAAAVAVGAIVGVAVSQEDDEDRIPLCP